MSAMRTIIEIRPLVRSIMQIHKEEASIVSEMGRDKAVTLIFPTAAPAESIRAR
jgi:hypothetical protein